MTITSPGVVEIRAEMRSTWGTPVWRIWTAEAIAALDWLRVVEIARAMASQSGFALGKTKTDAGGGAEFTMSMGRAWKRTTALVRLAPWGRRRATAACLESFAIQLEMQKIARGTYIAPGGFDPGAVMFAQRAGIETVHFSMLADKLNAFPEHFSNLCREICAASDASTPSCPICLNRLVKGANEPTSELDSLMLPDLHYRADDVVVEPVFARCLEVQRDCEVRFLCEVRAQEVIVNGTVVGEFICEGSVMLNDGAVLRGRVAARSVLVRPGAVLDGETCIVGGALKVLSGAEADWVWRCENPSGIDKCKAIRFVPHE